MSRVRLFAFFLVTSLLVAPFNVGHAETIRIAYNSDWPPFSVGEDETVDGVLVSLVEEILTTHYGFEVVNVGLPWARAQREVAEGRADAMVTFPSRKRKEYVFPTDEIVFAVETKAFVREGSEAQAALQKDQSIKVQRQFPHCLLLADNWSNEFLETHGIPFETGQDTEKCLSQIAAGRQDVFLHGVDSTNAALDALGLAGRIASLPKVYASIPLHFLLSKKSKIPESFVRKLDATIRAMKNDGRYDELLAKRNASVGPVYVATLEWPPYTGRALSGGGATTEIVRQAFAKSGLAIKPQFLPWKRAISYAKSDDDGIIAYYPGYHCRHEGGFIASEKIGQGPLRIAERTSLGINWRDLSDLEGLRIGTVVGYANTDEFDQWVSDGRLSVTSSHNDRENILNLAKGLIDIAIVDEYVFKSLMKSDDTLRNYQNQLQLDERPLQVHDLFLCIRDSKNGRNLLSKFNAGLKALDTDEVWATFLQAQ